MAADIEAHSVAMNARIMACRQGCCRLGQVFNGHVITSSCVLVRTEWTTRSHRPETSRTVLEMIFVARFLSPLREREREREVRVVFGSLNGDQVELKEVKTRGETGHVRSRLSTTRMTQSLSGIGIFLSKRGECFDAFFLTSGKVRRSIEDRILSFAN